MEETEQLKKEIESMKAKLEEIEKSQNERGFEKELRELINRYSLENESSTPDFILASYLNMCLVNFNETMKSRSKWYSSTVPPEAL